MKKNILTLLFFISSILYTQAQNCDLNLSADPTTITCGDQTFLSAFGISQGQVILGEDFNTSGYGPGWSGTPGSTDFSNPCSPAGVDGTPHAWMGNSTTVPRTLTSSTYDLTTATAGVTICFDLLFASQGDASPCEGPDEPDEGVYLEYSIDGGTTWITINYFDPNGGNDPQLTNWNNWCFPVPAGGITANTMFRWHQTADSGADYDHWGIDNVQIYQNDINSEVEWLHDGYSYGVGNAGGVNPNPVSPTTTTTYTAQITTGTGDVCTENITITVVDPVYDVNLTMSPTTICDGDCATISGTADIIDSPGGQKTFENSEFALITGTPALPGLPPFVPPTPGSINSSMNINVQGLNQPNVTNGYIVDVCINGFTLTSIGGNTDLSDIEIILECPSGTQINLVNVGDLSGNTIGQMCFATGAPPVSSGTAPYNGTFAPADPMANLTGCNSEGVWSLIIQGVNNDLSVPTGGIVGWDITFDDPPILSTPNVTWSPTTGLTNPNSVNTDACPNVSTTYELTLDNGVPGCATYTESFPLTVNPCNCTPPNIIINNPLTTCAPNTIDLANAIDPASDPANFTYHNTQADAQNGVNAISNIVGTTGSYWVRAEDPLDPTCYVELEIIVTIDPQDDASFTLTDFCTGDANNASNIATPGGTFTFNPVPGNGETIDANTGEISNTVGGTTYSIEYTTNGTCPNSNIQTVTANNCTNCLVTNLNINISACLPSGNYDVTGVVEFTDPPTTGQLIIEDCNGNQDVYNAPFTSPQNFTINAGAANGGACDITAYFSDETTCSQNIPYTAPTCPCNFDLLNVNIGPCDVGTNTFELNGTVEFSFPPSTGDLIIEDCNGNQTVFNAPFTSPQNFTISGITPDGANCSVTAYFTDNLGCTITSGNYNNPTNCTCPADAGSFTYTNNGVGTNNYVLCENDEFFITPNGDQVMPPDVGPLGGFPYDPGIAFLIYSCPPTPGLDPASDPCFEGGFAANGGITDINDLVFINSFPPGTFTDNTVYFAPMTMYNLPNILYNVDCWNIGPTFAVQYLNPITENTVTDCQTGTATVTLNGGYPEFSPGAVFTGSNLLPTSAQFDNTTAGNGGTITISGLVDGDNYSFDVVDDNGCPITISGGPFVGLEDASFSYTSNTYCQSATSPIPNITGVAGGNFTATPAGMVIDGPSGEIDLTNSTPGTYDVTYTSPDPTCFGTETVQVTIVADPVLDPVTDETACDDFTLGAISGTNLSGNEAYYTATNGGGAQYNPGDVISTTTTLFVYDETGTVPNCFDETSFNININQTPSLNAISDQDVCDEYVLPAINGNNLGGNEAYYDAPNGGGNQFNPGDVITASGTYYAYDETGTTPNCFDEVSFDVVVTPSPNFNVTSNPPSSCTTNDAEIVISGLDPNTSYEITYNDGSIVGPQSLTTDASGEIVITGLSDGSYTGFVVTFNNCTSNDNTVLNIVSPNNPVVDAGPDITVCEGESVTLSAFNPDGATITWDNGVSDGTPFTPTVGTTTYTVTATNALGCTTTDEINVTVNPLPTVNAGNDITICETDNVTLSGSGAQSYNWDLGVVDGVPFSPSTTQTYTVVGTDANGCQNSDQVTISVNPLPQVNFTTPVTNGCAPFSVSFENLSSTGAANCEWDFGNGATALGCDNVAYMYQNPGCYDVTLTVTGNNGCVNTFTFDNYICVDQAPVANFMYNPVRPLTSDPTVNFENLSQGATDYEWTFNDDGTSNSENPTYVFPDQAGEYPVELVAISESGCTDTTYSTVIVDEELIFYVPNTFTPDGNGTNEVFLPVMTSGFDPYDYELLIFNRWGEIIFESRNPWVGWDGTFKGNIVQDGTYVWKITIKDNYLDDLREFMGHVNVIR